MATKNKMNLRTGLTSSFEELVSLGLINDKTLTIGDKLPIVRGDVIRLPEDGKISWQMFDTEVSDGTIVSVKQMLFDVTSTSGLRKTRYMSLADLTRLPLQKAYGEPAKNLRWFIGGAFDATLDAKAILEMLQKGLVVEQVISAEHKKDCYALRAL